MGNEGLEPSRLSARDPKSRLSANSSTSPSKKIISEPFFNVNWYYDLTRYSYKIQMDRTKDQRLERYNNLTDFGI